MLNPVRKGFNSHNVYTCVDPWVCGAPPVNCHMAMAPINLHTPQSEDFTSLEVYLQL